MDKGKQKAMDAVLSSTSEEMFIINGDESRAFKGFVENGIRFRLPDRYSFVDFISKKEEMSSIMGLDKDTSKMVKIITIGEVFLADKRRLIRFLKDLKILKSLKEIPFFMGVTVILPQRIGGVRFEEIYMVYEEAQDFSKVMYDQDIKADYVITQLLIGLGIVHFKNIPFKVTPENLFLNGLSLRLGIYLPKEVEEHKVLSSSMQMILEHMDGRGDRESDDLRRVGVILSGIIYKMLTICSDDLFKADDKMATDLLKNLWTKSPRYGLIQALEHPFVERCLSRHPEWAQWVKCIKTPDLLDTLEQSIQRIHLGISEQKIRFMIYKEIIDFEKSGLLDENDQSQQQQQAAAGAAAAAAAAAGAAGAAGA